MVDDDEARWLMRAAAAGAVFWAATIGGLVWWVVLAVLG